MRSAAPIAILCTMLVGLAGEALFLFGPPRSGEQPAGPLVVPVGPAPEPHDEPAPAAPASETAATPAAEPPASGAPSVPAPAVTASAAPAAPTKEAAPKKVSRPKPPAPAPSPAPIPTPRSGRIFGTDT